ncbi:hypothetical protein IscW_ISCW011561 [Ixodes scapularis]|uniref:Uncharacterized protein n=1 Tax=Ixodes scapularis TaxID=6945 RepID=B7Q5Z2_IXOSC|nr:hypothetical protein IscW_ISCW011561 [Ixodes scapularis]|eukprot:XP_002411844.1 hypothetical protein IscW_ISCW011561 [Ixodes scapularis]
MAFTTRCYVESRQTVTRYTTSRIRTSTRHHDKRRNASAHTEQEAPGEQQHTTSYPLCYRDMKRATASYSGSGANMSIDEQACVVILH